MSSQTGEEARPLARRSHLCAGIVSPFRDSHRGHRPDYFAAFDHLLRQLEAQIPDPATRARVLTTLDEDGRRVDVHRLAVEHHLSRATVRLVRQLVRFGDEVGPVHSFASLRIAEIAPRASRQTQSVTTYVYATRRGSKVDYWWADSAEGFGALGVRDQPLTLREAVVTVERVIRAQAQYDVVDGGDRAAYLANHASRLQVRSEVYAELGESLLSRWRRRARSAPRTRR